MKCTIIFSIIVLVMFSGCQTIKKNSNFAVVVTPVGLPVSPEEGLAPMVFYDYVTLYDFLKNKNFLVEKLSDDPLIYKIPDQKGLLEELANMLKTLKTMMNVYSMNLANINTTRTEDGEPYRRKGLLINKDFEIEKIVGVPGDMKKIYDPSHPDSDKDGYLYLPNVNEIEEKVQMMNINRLYIDISKIIEKLNEHCVISVTGDYRGY